LCDGPAIACVSSSYLHGETVILRIGVVRINLVALLVVSSLTFPAFPAAAPFRSGDGQSIAVAPSSIRIDNFGCINPNYYRGAQPKGHDYSDLAALGVKTLIDLTGDDEAQANEKAMVEAAGMRYVHLPMTTHTAPSLETPAQFLAIVNDPARQPVYVHCVGGRHRTGVVTAAYRMSHDGWTAEQAFIEMKQYEFGADFLHREFKKFVYGYRPDLSNDALAGPTSASLKR